MSESSVLCCTVFFIYFGVDISVLAFLAFRILQYKYLYLYCTHLLTKKTLDRRPCGRQYLDHESTSSRQRRNECVLTSTFLADLRSIIAGLWKGLGALARLASLPIDELLTGELLWDLVTVSKCSFGPEVLIRSYCTKKGVTKAKL